MKTKLLCADWIGKLEVGSVVCDCRGKHLKVIAIGEELQPLFSSKIRQMCRFIFLPTSIELWLMTVWKTICFCFDLYELWDRQLELSDGAFCSARNCCAPGDHEHQENCTIID
jgi:hypothetical protein